MSNKTNLRETNLNLNKPCRYIPARNHGGETGPKRGIVFHCTGSDNTAMGTALYFHTSPSAGSTQKIVDDVECIRTVLDKDEAYGAPPFNPNCLHIEIEGPSTWKRLQWLAPKNLRRLRLAQQEGAEWCVRYGIPPTFPTSLPDNPDAFSGCTYHFRVSAKYHQSKHGDPGPGFPYRFFERGLRRRVRTIHRKQLLARG